MALGCSLSTTPEHALPSSLDVPFGFSFGLYYYTFFFFFFMSYCVLITCKFFGIASGYVWEGEDRRNGLLQCFLLVLSASVCSSFFSG